MREVYFHEDNNNLIELLPISNWDHCARQIKKGRSFADAHKAPAGAGWTDIYVIKQAPKLVSEFNISVDAIRALIEPHLAEFDAVFTGYGSYRGQCSGILAFGNSNPAATVYADHDDDNIVTGIWLDLEQIEASDVETLLRVFSSMSLRHDMLFVDWIWDVLLKLSDQTGLHEYLLARSERSSWSE